MRFWDASVVVPLLQREAASDAARGLYDRDPVMVVAWTTLEFVTLDDRLETAALKEGFTVIVPGR